MQGAERASRLAKTWSIVGISVGAVALVGYVALVGLAPGEGGAS